MIAEAGLARRRAAARRAVLRDELGARHAERIVEHELGGVRQPVTDLHDRQRAEAIRDRDAKHRRTLEHADCFERGLGVAGRHVARGALEQCRELGARGRRVEHALVQQFVEQQRLLGELPRKPRAVDDEFQQPLECGGVLVQKREVRAAATHRAEYRQNPLEGFRRGSVPADQLHRAAHDRGEPLSTDLVHALVQTAAAKIGEQSACILVGCERRVREHRGSVAGFPGGADGIDDATGWHLRLPTRRS